MRREASVKVNVKVQLCLLRDKEEVKLSFQLLPYPRLISHPIMNLAYVVVTRFPS